MKKLVFAMGLVWIVVFRVYFAYFGLHNAKFRRFLTYLYSTTYSAQCVVYVIELVDIFLKLAQMGAITLSKNYLTYFL